MKNRNIPPKKMLVPLDFSPTGFRAWELARELGRVLGAALEVLFVYEPPPLTAEVGPVSPLTERLIVSLETDLRRRIGAGAPVWIREGFASDEILRLAAEHGTDLIVMGTHGRTGPLRVLAGSVAESVARRSPVPVLTVRGGFRRFQSILVPVNFTEYSIEGMFDAADLAEALGARFDVLNVGANDSVLKIPEFNDAVSRLRPYFSAKPPRLLRRDGVPAAEIIAAGADYDLIALVSHRKSLFRDVVVGTTAERVLRHSPVPVLSLPSGVQAKPVPPLEVREAARR